MKLIIKFYVGLILSVLITFTYSNIVTEKIHADTIDAWTLSSIHLPNTLASHVSHVIGDKLFIIGGATNDDYSNSYSAALENNELASSFVSETSLPSTRFWISTAQKDYAYILGGASFNGSVSFESTVYAGILGSDEILWNNYGALPHARAQGGAVVVDNWIYYAGGFDSSGKKQEIFYAPINPDGTLGAWATSTISLPIPMNGFGMVARDNHIIIVGGDTTGGTTNKVYKATVDILNGSLSAWQELEPLPQARAAANQTVIAGSWLVAVGGGGSGILNNVYYAFINSDGTIEPWEEGANLPSPVGSGALTYLNGYLYLSGGVDGSGYLDTVYFAKINQPETGTHLDVPLLKQTDPLWGGNLYDSANLWTSAGQQGISNWGCALTSAVMVFKYHGINKLPDGVIDLEPGTLNTWLKSQPDGYIRNGLVNWLALSRFSKQVSLNNPGLGFEALEYKRTGGQNNAQLVSDIQNGIPNILEVPGHFIVGKGEDGGVFEINDPYYDRTELSDYSNSFMSAGRYIPSSTDLSYIALVFDQGVNAQLVNSSNISVGEEFIQQPLDNDVIPGNDSGDTLKTIYLPLPSTGIYKFNVSASTPKNYSLDGYLYDENGEVKMIQLVSVVGPGDVDQIIINFDKANIDNSSFDQQVSFDTFINDINSLYKSGEIKKQNYNSLLVQALLAKKLYKVRITRIASIALLKIMQKDIKKYNGKGITNSAFVILDSDLFNLLKTLTL